MNTRMITTITCSLALLLGTLTGSAKQNKTDKRDRGQNVCDGRQSNLQLDRTGWVRVGYDYDQDGYFDAVEMINVYDLEKARKSSKQRQQTKLQQRNSQQQRQRAMQDVKGEILDLRTFSLAGQNDQHLFAKLRTPEGRIAKVDLGPQAKLDDVDFREGDRLRVTGTIGKVNDRAVLMARTLYTGQQRVNIDRRDSRQLRRVTGDILRTATVDLGDDTRHVIAKVDLNQGPTCTVILGHTDEVSRERLRDAKQLSMLIREVRIDGQRAFLAESIGSGDNRVNVKWQNPRQNLDRAPQKFKNSQH